MRQNPLFYYGYAFTLSLILYMLNFSTIFPSIPWQLILFLVFSIGLAFLIGHILNKITSLTIHDKETIISLKRLKIFIGYLLIASDFLLDSSTWPLIRFFLNFGIPFSHVGSGTETLHVLAVTYSSYLAIALFSSFFKDKQSLSDKMNFFVFFILYPALLFNRGYIIFITVALFFIYFNFKKLLLKSAFKLLLVVVICTFVFGIFGNLRTSGKALNSEPILSIGEASEAFLQSSIPKPFFWGYIYLVSPIANLALNVAQQNHNLPLEYCISTFIPDFIQKRLNVNLNVSAVKITEALNVATIFTSPYLYLGWTGILGAYFFILMFTGFLFYLSTFLTSNDKIVLRGILASICFHTFFVNSIIFSGFSFQIIYPLLFSFIEVTLKPKHKRLVPNTLNLK